jgi:hypothetical protein
MNLNPYADGKIRAFGDAIIRAIVHGLVIAVSWNAPFAWYRHCALPCSYVRCRHRRLLDAAHPVGPAYEKILESTPDAKAMHDETREWQVHMAILTEKYSKKNR